MEGFKIMLLSVTLIAMTGSFLSFGQGRKPICKYILSIAIAGSNDHVYVWYKDGTVSSGTTNDLDKYRRPYRYYLPYTY